MSRVLGLALMVLAWVSQSAVAATLIEQNGPASNRINMVILGDGYTSTQQAQFATDAAKIATQFFAQEPWTSYRPYFNVWRIDRVSNQSGLATSQANATNTAFGAYYNCLGIARLACADTAKVNAAVAAEISAGVSTMVILLVNDTIYAASGGAITVLSLSSSAFEVLPHEVGHSFANLSDEYVDQATCDAGTYGKPVGTINVAETSTRSSLPWQSWVDAATTLPTTGALATLYGAYQGAYFCPQYFRPNPDSKMRTLGLPYYAINEEQVIRSIYTKVSPISAISPASTFIKPSVGQPLSFGLTPLAPTGGSVGVTWRLNGSTVGTGTNLTLSASTLAALTAGTNTLEASVIDLTAKVRTDPNNVMTRKQAWVISNPAAPVPAPGWWWNAAEPGRGFSIEQQGDKVFMAAYLYETSGRATWYVAGPATITNGVMTAPLTAYGFGQTLTGGWRAPQTSTNVGTITLRVTDANNAVITWPGGTVPITRFDIVTGGVAADVPANNAQSGWWWNPSEGGRGFMVEVQNNTMFLAGYMYDSTGAPVWYASGPTAMITPTLYQGNWVQYGNGQSLTGAFKSASVANSNVGSVTLRFSSTDTATLTLPSGATIPLSRFKF
jgi:hypothetical protein